MHYSHGGDDDNKSSVTPHPDDKGGPGAGSYGSEDQANLPIPGEGEAGVSKDHQ
jgi:hypothetical protein